MFTMAEDFDFYDISAFEKLDCSFSYNKENLPNHNAQISDRTIVGQYNVLIDKLNDKATEKKKVLLEDVKPSYMIKLSDNNDAEVNYDLTEGYDPEVSWKDDGEARKIDGILQYFIESEYGPVDSDFVMNRCILTKLMTTPYYPKPYEGSRFSFQWLFGAQKFGDTIYMCYYPDSYLWNSIDTYSGHRFASCITSDMPYQMKSPESPVMTSMTKFNVVQSLALGNKSADNGLRLFFSSNIKGIDFGKTKIEPENFVEIKTTKKRKNKTGNKNYIDWPRWLSYWTQCYLSDIPKLVLGIKTDDTQIAERIEQRKVEDIPMYTLCRTNWNKQVTLDFAYEYLRTVQTAMKDQKDPNTVYLFHHKNGEYDFRKVSKENPNFNQYQVLPQWFLNGMNN